MKNNTTNGLNFWKEIQKKDTMYVLFIRLQSRHKQKWEQTYGQKYKHDVALVRLS